MTENIENIENSIKIESKGQRDLILQELRIRKENQQLKKDNQLLSDELTYFKERCADLEEQMNDLQSENTHFKAKNLALTKRLQNITLWDLSPEAQEEAGHALARSLLGGK